MQAYLCSRVRDLAASATATAPRPSPKRSRFNKTVQRTYPQNWRAYNAAQTHEKERFLDLLRDLCGGIAETRKAEERTPALANSGRDVRRLLQNLFDRFRSALHDGPAGSQAKGYISKTPHFNSIFNYLENPALTPILRRNDHGKQPAAQGGRGRFRRRLVRLHDLAFHPLVRSQVRRGAPTARMGKGPFDVRREDEHRDRR